MKRFDTWFDRLLDWLIPESGNYKPKPVSTETIQERVFGLECSTAAFRGYFMSLFRSRTDDRIKIAALEKRMAAMEERMQRRTSVGTVAERN